MRVELRRDRLRPVNTDCRLARAGFGQEVRRYTPRIDGRSATLEQACGRAGELLGDARRPLIAGLGTDAAGMRAALALAERVGAVIDHAHGSTMVAQLRALQEEGSLTTTFAEVRNRADLILFLGTNTRRRYPRFIERMAHNRHALARRRGEPRLIYLGPSIAGFPGETLRCRINALNEVAGAVAALASGHRLQVSHVDRIPTERIAELTEELQAARYGVAVWDAADLQPDLADLQIRTFCTLVRALNQRTRWAGLPLGGNDGGATALSVCTWQSGYPPRADFRRGYPEYDPVRYDHRRLLATGEADVLLWLSAFDGGLRPPPSRVPSVFLLRADRPPPRRGVYIPVATPGLDQAGLLFRADGIVSLPLQDGLTQAGHPAADSVLNCISRRLSNPGWREIPAIKTDVRKPIDNRIRGLLRKRLGEKQRS